MNGMSDVGASRLSSVAGDDADIGGHRPCDDAMSTGTDRRLSDEQLRELWLYPDTSRIFELSTKCRSDEALPVAVKTRLLFSEAGVDLSDEQQTKTKTALEYFAKGVAS
jgi:hypothetical protein